MPPSQQERRCVVAVCQHLSQETGSRWDECDWLDQGRDEERTPDVSLTDGTDRIELEITQLTAGRRFDAHDNAQLSLHCKLAPDTTSSFALYPPPPLELPLDQGLVRQLKRSVASAARDMSIGSWTNVLIHRRATVKYLGSDRIDSVFCRHTQNDYSRVVSREVRGVYCLEDDGPDHQFLTEERYRSFCAKLLRACRESKQHGQVLIEWSEEWQMYRRADVSGGRGGVAVYASVVDQPEAAAFESVSKALTHAKSKFHDRDQEKRAAVALHAGEQRGHLLFEIFERAINRLSPSDVQPLGRVFLIGDNEVRSWQFDV